MKTEITGNEPAMPVSDWPTKLEGSDKWVGADYSGLTIRQQFAMAAMQGLNANPEHVSLSLEKMAEWAVVQADLLIQELNKPNL